MGIKAVLPALDKNLFLSFYIYALTFYIATLLAGRARLGGWVSGTCCLARGSPEEDFIVGFGSRQAPSRRLLRGDLRCAAVLILHQEKALLAELRLRAL